MIQYLQLLLNAHRDEDRARPPLSTASWSR